LPVHGDDSILDPEQDELVPDIERHNSDLSILRRRSSQAGRHSHSDRRRITIFKQFESASRVKANANPFEREKLAEAQKRAVAAIQTEYQNLVLKHKWEIDCLLHSTKKNVDCFEKTRDAHIGRME
jgi:hypothetical protein